MAKTVQYILVTNSDTETFSNQVNDALRDGWELYGHPFSRPIKETSRLCQALIKETMGPGKITQKSILDAL